MGIAHFRSRKPQWHSRKVPRTQERRAEEESGVYLLKIARTYTNLSVFQEESIKHENIKKQLSDKEQQQTEEVRKERKRDNSHERYYLVQTSRFKWSKTNLLCMYSGREGPGVDRQVEVASQEAGQGEETESDRGVVLETNLVRKPEKLQGAGQGAVTKPGPEADPVARTKSSRKVCPKNVPRRKRPKSRQMSLKTGPKVLLKRKVLQLKAKAMPLRGTISKFKLSCKRVIFFDLKN